MHWYRIDVQAGLLSLVKIDADPSKEGNGRYECASIILRDTGSLRHAADIALLLESSCSQ